LTAPRQVISQESSARPSLCHRPRPLPPSCEPPRTTAQAT